MLTNPVKVWVFFFSVVEGSGLSLLHLWNRYRWWGLIYLKWLCLYPFERFPCKQTETWLTTQGWAFKKRGSVISTPSEDWSGDSEIIFSLCCEGMPPIPILAVKNASQWKQKNVYFLTGKTSCLPAFPLFVFLVTLVKTIQCILICLLSISLKWI